MTLVKTCWEQERETSDFEDWDLSKIKQQLVPYPKNNFEAIVNSNK